MRYPEYIRGHHPNTTANTAKRAGWNRGMKKGDHPSLERMGYQPGHKPFNDWSHVNRQLREDPELKARWLQAKKGNPAWNKGLTRDQYPNGIASGPDHGNWAGGYNGLRDTAEYERLRQSILKRDNWTCVLCNDHNHVGRGSRIKLHVDHIVPVCEAPFRIMDPSNLRTLCEPCHFKTETFGSKAVKRMKIRARNQAAKA